MNVRENFFFFLLLTVKSLSPKFIEGHSTHPSILFNLYCFVTELPVTDGSFDYQL